jgi:hypothetical protein
MEESADSKELLVDIDLDLTAQVVLFIGRKFYYAGQWTCVYSRPFYDKIGF